MTCSVLVHDRTVSNGCYLKQNCIQNYSNPAQSQRIHLINGSVWLPILSYFSHVRFRQQNCQQLCYIYRLVLQHFTIEQGESDMKLKNKATVELGRIYDKQKNSYALNYRKKMELKESTNHNHNQTTYSSNILRHYGTLPPPNPYLKTSTSLENGSSRHNSTEKSPTKQSRTDLFNKTMRITTTQNRQPPSPKNSFTPSSTRHKRIQSTSVISPFSQLHNNASPRSRKDVSPIRQYTEQKPTESKFGNETFTRSQAILIEDSPPRSREELMNQHKAILDKIKKVKQNLEREELKIKNAEITLKERKRILNLERKENTPILVSIASKTANSSITYNSEPQKLNQQPDYKRLQKLKEEHLYDLRESETEMQDLQRNVAELERKSQHLTQKIQYFQGIKEEETRKQNERMQKKNDFDEKVLQEKQLVQEKEALQKEIQRIETTIRNLSGQAPISELVSLHLNSLEKLRMALLKREYEKVETYIRSKQEAKTAKRQSVRLKEQLNKKREDVQTLRKKTEERRKQSQKLHKKMQDRMAQFLQMMS